MDLAKVGLQFLAGVLGVVVGFWLKDFLPAFFRKKGENLATKQDIEEITEKIETVKAGITRLETEHEVRFTALHEKRAKVIVRIYRDIVAVERVLQLFNPVSDGSEVIGEALESSDTDPPEYVERRQQALAELRDAWQILDQDFAENEIYFHGEVLQKLRHYRSMVMRAGIGVTFGKRVRDHNRDLSREMMGSALKISVERIPPIKRAIEAEFRALLGVEESEEG